MDQHQLEIPPPWELGPIHTWLAQGKVTLQDRQGNPIELPDGTRIWFESRIVTWTSSCGSVEYALDYPKAVYRRSNKGGTLEFENGKTAELDQLNGNHQFVVMRSL